jgi:hypothetical protein
MIKAYWIILLLLPALSCFSQIRATTEFGETVNLYDDGTWEYVSDSSNSDQADILTNPNLYVKSSKSDSLVKSERLNIGVWINPTEWYPEPGNTGEYSEILFHKDKEDLYAVMITERIEVPLTTLRDIAISNARSAAPDLEVLQQEYRMVNGTQVLMIQMRGTVQGIKFKYIGYYYSDAEGSVQLLTYSSERLFPLYKNDMEVFLNGFVTLQ